jgi:drug/metabolite transporter (DMT)-like permease
MSIPRTTAWGIALAGATALISGVSVFANGLIVKDFPDPIALAGARNGLVGLFLVGALVARGGIGEVRAVGRFAWRDRAALLALAVIGGGIPFVLFFSGLAAAGGPGAAIIHKTMFVWVAVLAVPLLRETLGWGQIVALGALVAGTLLVGPTTGLGADGGGLMILLATLFWAVEVVVARRLLAAGPVSVGLAAAVRMAVGAALILGFLAVTGRIAAIAAFGPTQWLLIGATGLLLLGYVATWYAALQRAPATVVSAVLVGGAVVTAALSAIRTGSTPAPTVVDGLVLLAVAAAAVAALTLRRGRGSLGPLPASHGA